ncbi:hypothetical protein NPIL_306991, partial [Nephila pilipes]
MDPDDKTNCRENGVAKFHDNVDVTSNFDFFSTLDQYTLSGDTLTTNSRSLS